MAHALLRTARTSVRGTQPICATMAPRCFSTVTPDDRARANVLWFNELGMGDVPLVGGKNASLGEMYRQLGSKGVKVPNGFAVTATAYHNFLREAGIAHDIQLLMKDLDARNVQQLQHVGAQVRATILNAELPAKVSEAILMSYETMEQEYGKQVDTAVRSSATAEDLPDASFAGQQETFLNIRGDTLLSSCRRCFASLFTDRAISYRTTKGFDHFSIGLSIAVQKMVRSDEGASGVMFTIDTETGFQNAITINGAWGLGENVVQGAVNPDEWRVFKPSLAKPGTAPIITSSTGSKKMRMIYSSDPSEPVRNVETSEEMRKQRCLSEEEVVQLARWGSIIEDHYSAIRGQFTAMDIEWARDGLTNEMYIVQARPETVHSQADASVMRTYELQGTSKALTQGASVGSLIGVGEANVIMDVSSIHDFVPGQVLVTEMTDPDWEPILKKAAAVVTNSGGRTCHAAIISRELGIPCLVGCETATQAIKSGEVVTVDCSSGETGTVWEGQLPYKVNEVALDNIPETRTSIMMNLANPAMAFKKSFIPNKGVGLARMEFIVNNHIKAHPLALLDPDSAMVRAEDRAAIKELIADHKDGRDYFVDTLSQGIGTLAAAFYPNKVILRFSDFKTNEYANLLGGANFEPNEENPMIGWRGASRYYSDSYRAGFAMECEAVKRVRERMGLDNLVVMVPFCRTPEEGRKVVAEMARNGLHQSDGVSIYCMCEIPSNVILANEFLDVFDGFSIGSNDLTQLVLGVDRDSATVAHIYDERNAAVKEMIKRVIDVARARGKYVGICGQGPSDYPDFAEFLVECGIESMSLTPDTVLSTTLAVKAVEDRVGAAAADSVSSESEDDGAFVPLAVLARRAAMMQ